MMPRQIYQDRLARRTKDRGFSMIEVLVALLILAFGLLGFALLQTMNLRYSQSANHRTQATNLAYDLLDQMRANRYQAAWYTGSSGAGFAPGAVDREEDCQGAAGANPSAPLGAVTLAQSRRRWQCQVVRTLGETAGATVEFLPDGRVAVAVYWGDERWDPDAWDTTQTATKNAFALVTRL